MKFIVDKYPEYKDRCPLHDFDYNTNEYTCIIDKSKCDLNPFDGCRYLKEIFKNSDTIDVDNAFQI